ncbi:MAG: DNA topoisomerase IV subunit A [Rhodospirillales bacterium]
MPKAARTAAAKPRTAPAEVVTDSPLADALSERYLAYALSTIMSRSLPDVRDGLKPVHRRLLYAMRQLRLDPASGPKKCARVVGDVIGKYHPHGDTAVYDALVRLAQEFAQRYPLIDGQGNFGSIDGDNAAAMRYTEARLTAAAAALMEGIDENAVDFRATYDGEDSEPAVLPARFPNLLANGSAGIAVGMATSIPPHNAGEICDALLHLLKSPNARIDTLVEMIPGPDFPTGGVLIEPRDQILEAYRTGRGGFRVRARWAHEDLGRGAWQAVITEIPFQVQKARLIERIADLMTERKLPFLADVRDESTTEVRIVLEPRNRAVEPDVLMEQLFRQTELESRFSLNMNVLDAANTPSVMDLRGVLAAFLEHRLDVLARRARHRLEKIEARLHILDGFLIAYLNLDEVIKIIREKDDAKAALIKAFKLTEIQADAILNMRLRQLRKLEETEIKSEHKDLTAEGKMLRALLKDEGQQKKAVADEIQDIKKTFGQKTELGRRRTEIGEPPTAVIVPLDAMVEREQITVVCSEKGWIRAVRGHVEDTDALKYKDGDGPRFVMHADTTDKLVIFAADGRFFTFGCDKLPGGRGHGEPVRLMADMPAGVDPAAMLIHRPGRKLIVASNTGRGFIVPEDAVIAQTRTGKQVLNLGKGEQAKACAVVGEDADAAAIVGDNRKLLIFKLDELPEMTRGRGVIMQRYKKGDLSDVTTLNLKEGLAWSTGAGRRVESGIKPWTGKRGQAGLLAPRGFPRSKRFS